MSSNSFAESKSPDMAVMGPGVFDCFNITGGKFRCRKLFHTSQLSAGVKRTIISLENTAEITDSINISYAIFVEKVPASLQVVKAGADAAPLKGTEFALPGGKGTSVSGTTGHNGQVVWRDLPADEEFTLMEAAAPESYQIVAPMAPSSILLKIRPHEIQIIQESDRR